MDIKNKINRAIVDCSRKSNSSIDYMFLSKSDYNDLFEIMGIDIENRSPTFWNIKFFIYEGTDQIFKLITNRSISFPKEVVISYEFEDVHILSFKFGFDIDTTEVANGITKNRPYIFSDMLVVSNEVLKDVLEWIDKFKHPFVEINIQVLQGSIIKIRFKGILKNKTDIEDYHRLVLSHTIKKFKYSLSFLN